MADSNRKDKLAAAKKKLKKFQGKKGSDEPSFKGISDDVADKSSSISKDHPSIGNAANAIESTPHKNMNGRKEDTTSGQKTSLEGERTTESTERLQQLSRQVNGLISESNQVKNASVTSNNGDSVQNLEIRNQQLAALLDQHTKANATLTKQLEELRLHNHKLQLKADEEKRGFDVRFKREAGSLKEQLQVHIQTIGILVAEKTELQSSLNHSQKLSEQKIGELDELSGRLKASRQRVADLERSFSSASSSNQKNEKAHKDLSKEVDRLKLELFKLNKSNEEFQQQNSELQGKLQKKVTECSSLEDKGIEMKGKLEMTELHLTQLQNTDHHTVENTEQIDKLVAEKTNLQARLDQHETQLQRAQTERDQYHSYIDQQNQQTHHLQLQINSLLDEKTQLEQEKKSLEETMQEFKSREESFMSTASQAEGEQQELHTALQKTTADLERLNQAYQAQVNDNSQLSKMVTEKETHILSIEQKLEQLGEEEVDKEQLLEDLQSDKTALSRAMAQNKQLKHQLAELQNGFVTLSNDNMDMMTQLQSEQHVSKELATRLSQQEQELKEIREQITEKERLLQQLEHGTHNEDSQNPADIEQRIKDFQEHTPLLESMQRELSSAQDTINALTNQNSELRAQMLRNASSLSLDSDTSLSSSQVDSLSASIRQLELERGQLQDQLSSEQVEKDSLLNSLKDLQDEIASRTPATLNGDIINKAQFDVLQHAMKQLESKYTKAMRDKADLSDQMEQLEHIVLQLQGESDTIGEYVALYQTQRTLLKQRQLEKDDYISRLARDREDMQSKLGQLQGLVMQLLGEKQMLHSYTQQHADLPNNLDSSLLNHVPPSSTDIITPNMQRKTKKSFGSNLDSSHLEDWPDYTSSDSDSDVSVVEPIMGKEDTQDGSAAASQTLSPSPHTPDHPDHPAFTSPSSPSETSSDIPPPDQTAQKIMHLLTEIGSSNLVNLPTRDDAFLHCGHCTGYLMTV